MALFSGDFLEGFSLRDSPEFDDWQIGEADALRRELGSALRRLVELLLRARRVRAGAPARRRWLALDPLHEPAHRELIRLYAWSGDRAAALEQYRHCVRTLSQELGVAPLDETAALFEQVNDGTLAAPGPEPARARAPPARARPARAPPSCRWSDAPMRWRAARGARRAPGRTAAWP